MSWKAKSWLRYEAFLNLADKKKEVFDEDLESLVNEQERNDESAAFVLESVQISCGFPLKPTAPVTLRNEADQIQTACEWGTMLFTRPAARL